MKVLKNVLILGMLAVSISANATYFSTDAVTDWYIKLDNGVVYVNHPQFVAPCTYGRVEVRDSEPYTAEYAKRLVAAIYLAKAMGKAVSFVWSDTTAPTCVLSSIIISN